VLQDASLRNDLRVLGRANVARYSWEASARTVSRLIDRTLAGKHNHPAIARWNPGQR